MYDPGRSDRDVPPAALGHGGARGGAGGADGGDVGAAAAKREAASGSGKSLGGASADEAGAGRLVGYAGGDSGGGGGNRGPKGRQDGEEDLKSLVDSVLRLERIDPCIFVGRKVWRPPFARGVFGGCVLGQALTACAETVAAGKHVHSMHSYFLLAGKEDVPIVYTVTKLRDGHSFSSRAVSATQDGVCIFHATASFCVAEHSAFRHQAAMPEAPDPESLLPQEQVWRQVARDERLPAEYRSFIEGLAKRSGPIDIRYCDPVSPFAEVRKREPYQRAWVRAKGAVGDSMNLHRCVAAYFSDHVLLSTANRPHGVKPGGINMMASLDHTLWFHTPFRADEWMLYEVESPFSGDNRGFCLGRLFTRDGRLAVSVAQEGVIRLAQPDEADVAPPPAKAPPAASKL